MDAGKGLFCFCFFTWFYLHVGYLILFPLVLLHLVLQELQPGPHECVVVAAVHFQLALVHVHDVVAHAVQKVLER